MNKKGVEEQIFLIYYLLAGAIILLVLLYIVQKDLTGPGILKQYLVRDISLLTSTTYNSDGEVEIDYPLKYPYEITIEKGLVKIKTAITTEFPTTYPYLSHENYKDTKISFKNFKEEDETRLICNIEFSKTETQVSADIKEPCIEQM